MSFNRYWQAEQKRRAVAEAIAVLKEGDQQAHQRLYKALRQASLLLPVEQLPEGLQNGDLLVGENVQIKLKMIKNQKKQAFLPLFTSEATLRRVHSEEQSYLVLNFKTVAQMALHAKVSGILVDRGGPASAVVQLPVLLALLRSGKEGPSIAGSKEATQNGVQNAAQIRVAPPPRVLNYDEVAALYEWLGNQTAVVGAYLFGLIRDGNQAILTVGLDIPDVPTQEEMKQMARGLREVLGPSALILIDARLATLLARQAGALRFDLRNRLRDTNEAGSQSTEEPRLAE